MLYNPDVIADSFEHLSLQNTDVYSVYTAPIPIICGTCAIM